MASSAITNIAVWVPGHHLALDSSYCGLIFAPATERNIVKLLAIPFISC